MNSEGLTVIKLGGSQAFSPHLGDWMEAITACAGRVVVVPGGGPFADAVRLAQPRMGFSDRAAHHMALLAMEQFGCALAGMHGRWTMASSVKGIRHVLRARGVPVWAPVRMVLGAREIPASWEVTSDSLAAWLAGKLEASRLILVKHLDKPPEPLGADQIVANGLVDPMFPRFSANGGVPASIVDVGDFADVKQAISDGTAAGALVD